MRFRHKLMNASALIVLALFTCSCKQQTTEMLILPDDTAYIVTYSTLPSEEKEYSQLNYLDKNGTVIGKDVIDGVTDVESVQIQNGQAQVFTHDRIYFERKEPIDNTEMQTTYQFATGNGEDCVYASGLLEQSGYHYKLIPHGLAYKQEKLGFFDLVTLYNEDTVRNVRVRETTSIADDQENSCLYTFSYSNDNRAFCDCITYHETDDTFSMEEQELDLSEFRHKENDLIEFGKAVVKGKRVYVLTDVGDDPVSHYMMEFRINSSDRTLTYQAAYPYSMKDGDWIGIDTPVIADSNMLRYYSLVHPNRILVFDTQKKLIEFSPFLPNEQELEEEMPHIRKENEDLYLLQTKMDDNTFSISAINEDGSLDLLLETKLPKSKLHSCRVSDFCVIS